jgi:hypothetical protein
MLGLTGQYRRVPQTGVAAPQFVVGPFPVQLHDGVTTLPPDLHKSLGGQYATDIAARQDLKPPQREPRSA